MEGPKDKLNLSNFIFGLMFGKGLDLKYCDFNFWEMLMFKKAGVLEKCILWKLKFGKDVVLEKLLFRKCTFMEYRVLGKLHLMKMRVIENAKLKETVF